jgi:single-stranded-DNA-specific exonuclease
VEQKLVGNGNEHLKLKVKQAGAVWDVMGFDQGAYVAEIAPYIDTVCNLELNRWNGQETLRLNLLDFEPSK